MTKILLKKITSFIVSLCLASQSIASSTADEAFVVENINKGRSGNTIVQQAAARLGIAVAQKSYIPSYIQSQLGEVQEERDRAKSQLKARTNEYEQLKKREQALNAQKTDLETQLKKLAQERDQRAQALEAQKTKLESQLQKLDQALQARTKEREQLEQELKAQKTKLESQLQKLDQALQDRTKERDQLVQALNTQNAQKTDLESQLQKLDQERDQLAQALKAQKVDLENQLQNLTNALQTRTNECEQLKKRAQELGAQKADLENQLQTLTDALQTRTNECEQLEKRAQELGEQKADLENQLQNLTDALQTRTKECEQLEQKVRELDTQKNDLESQRQNLTEGKERLEKGNEDLTGQLAEFQRTLSKVANPENRTFKPTRSAEVNDHLSQILQRFENFAKQNEGMTAKHEDARRERDIHQSTATAYKGAYQKLLGTIHGVIQSSPLRANNSKAQLLSHLKTVPSTIEDMEGHSNTLKERMETWLENIHTEEKRRFSPITIIVYSAITTAVIVWICYVILEDKIGFCMDQKGLDYATCKDDYFGYLGRILRGEER